MSYDSFEDRFNYLRIRGSVGSTTFGFERYLNQKFYTSREWRQVRQHVIARDGALDLGIEDREIFDKIIIHHMNPMVVDDIVRHNEDILDPEFLITTCHETHNAIHYGDLSTLPSGLITRTPGDTIPWR